MQENLINGHLIHQEFLLYLFFLLLKKNLITKNNCKIKKITAENYGHCDILDISYANFMHETRLSVGYKNRSLYNNIRYHQWLAVMINNLKNNKLCLLKEI